MVRELIEAELAARIGAEHGERAPERRTAQRNGYRYRDCDTRVGTIELAIFKLRRGSFMPSMLERRRRAGAGRRRAGALRQRRLDPHGGPVSRAARAARDEQGPG